MESISHFGSCYLHQNRFPDHSLCYIDNIAFVLAVVVVVVVVAAVVVEVKVGTADYPSIQDSHVVLVCLCLAVSFCLFSG
jgi:hypothetical protein